LTLGAIPEPTQELQFHFCSRCLFCVYV